MKAKADALWYFGYSSTDCICLMRGGIKSGQYNFQAFA